MSDRTFYVIERTKCARCKGYGIAAQGPVVQRTEACAYCSGTGIDPVEVRVPLSEALAEMGVLRQQVDLTPKAHPDTMGMNP